jgi:lipid II:glycine glycyltransferase (peptidoglycan interpeptide bridge formation enzyme)
MKADISIQTINETDQSAWDKAVSHPLQSWAWGDFRRSMGIKVERVGLFKQKKLIGGWQISFHKIPHTQFTIGYFPKGPIPDAQMTAKLREIGVRNQAVYIQIEPNIIIDPNSKIEYLKSLLPSHHPLFTKYTFILDLSKSEDRLLADMHQKTRYNIKVAQKHNVVVREDNSPAAFNKYLELEEETTKRQQFFAHNRKYQISMWGTMSNAGIAKLWTASAGGEILAAWILFYWKDTVYYPYGASGRNQRETMAPNLLLWEIAKSAKNNGFKKFDLWGAIGPNPDEKDPWYGFHRFKQGYNPDLIEFAGSFDLVLNPLLYKAYCLADDIRWKALKFRL